MEKEVSNPRKMVQSGSRMEKVKHPHKYPGAQPPPPGETYPSTPKLQSCIARAQPRLGRPNDYSYSDSVPRAPAADVPWSAPVRSSLQWTEKLSRTRASLHPSSRAIRPDSWGRPHHDSSSSAPHPRGQATLSLSLYRYFFSRKFRRGGSATSLLKGCF